MATGESFRSLAFAFRISQSYLTRIIRMVLQSLNLINKGGYFPPPSKIPNSDISLPYVHVGDEAFRLESNMMRPYTRVESRKDYEKTVFNYRLSRARRTMENSFGLLSQIFRVFYTPISLKTETVDYLVLTACCLHNLLRDRYLENSGKHYYDYDSNEPQNTNNMIPLARVGGYGNFEGFFVRDELKKFFNSPEGAVQWQNYQVKRTDIT
ncbi:unnamed protein product [Macrosiphum euphorbiae]|uniref:DDE Tnp4 domain-containing protein n=1 Tax=Macrosiphum euphorbiae TaxID=13131 RepID=A0AAV0XZY4_9HEMI|nr:unnamed protein product [Macrosiphum euphorbiae]